MAVSSRVAVEWIAPRHALVALPWRRRWIPIALSVGLLIAVSVFLFVCVTFFRLSICVSLLPVCLPVSFKQLSVFVFE